MFRKAPRLNRRSFLRGTGVACALPFLETMSFAKTAKAPVRMCFLYFPNGCSLPNETDVKNKQWRWYPEGEGKDYKFTKVLESLEPHRKEMSIIGGLSHPKSQELLGHIAGDTWLTAGDLRGGQYKNRISVDQHYAQFIKKETRLPSLVMSIDGGVGYKSRSSTLSYDLNGSAIPAEYRQRDIFERYFSAGTNSSVEDRKRTISQGKKLVDLILEDSKAFKQKVSVRDQRKIDEYLSSLNSIEEQIIRNEEWLNIPMKAFSADHLDLDLKREVDPGAYLRSSLDLIALAFEVDLTRSATYMLAREDGMGFGDAMPRFALGLNKNHHKISHDKSKGHWAEWGAYDAWLASHFEYFVSRLKNTKDEYGSLLDNTMVVYGSSCSTTHDAVNAPTILAGGGALGINHGAYTVYGQKHANLSDLFLGMLQTAGIKTDKFGDSHGPLEGIFKSA